MMAYWLQQYWGYDTFIVLLVDKLDPNIGHACAYVNSSEFDPDVFSSLTCPNHDDMIYKGCLYKPVDWNYCPNWNFNHYKTEWFDVYSPEAGTWYHTNALEWFHLLDYEYYLRPTEGISSSSIIPEVVPTSVEMTIGDSERGPCGAPCSQP